MLLPDEIDVAARRLPARVAAAGCAVVLVTHKLAEIAASRPGRRCCNRGRMVARSGQPADRDRHARAGDDPARTGSTRPTARRRAACRSAAAQAPTTRAALGEARRRCRSTASAALDRWACARLDDITLSVDRGEIVGIAGVEGNGQSELGAMLAGMMRAERRPLFAGGPRTDRGQPARTSRRGRGHRARGPARGRLRHGHLARRQPVPQPACDNTRVSG